MCINTSGHPRVFAHPPTCFPHMHHVFPTVFAGMGTGQAKKPQGHLCSSLNGIRYCLFTIMDWKAFTSALTCLCSVLSYDGHVKAFPGWLQPETAIWGGKQEQCTLDEVGCIYVDIPSYRKCGHHNKAELSWAGGWFQEHGWVTMSPIPRTSGYT